MALAIADNVNANSKETYCGKIKCADIKATITNKEAPKASKAVMIITLLPKAFNVVALKDVPMEKAIKPRATVETHPI